MISQKLSTVFFLFGLTLVAGFSSSVSAQNVTTYKYDNWVSGINPRETILTPANVNVATFGKLFSNPIDGQAYAQPLYLANVAIPNKGTHNVIYLATCHDTVYSFDADTGGDPLKIHATLEKGTK